jgi:hypothetical protein
VQDGFHARGFVAVALASLLVNGCCNLSVNTV